MPYSSAVRPVLCYGMTLGRVGASYESVEELRDDMAFINCMQRSTDSFDVESSWQHDELQIATRRRALVLQIFNKLKVYELAHGKNDC